MKKLTLILALFFVVCLQAQEKVQIDTKSVVYELKTTKAIDGVGECTHAQEYYVLDEKMIVGIYGILDEEGNFVGLYGNATIPKMDLIDYVEVTNE